MRTELMQYLKSIRLGAYGVTDELPFSNSGIPMYLKNAKKIYVDKDQVSVEDFIPVLNGTISAEVDTVRVYLTTDAKNIPSDYDTVVSLIRAGKDVSTDPVTFFRRECTSATSFENDLMVTEFEFRFTKLI